jgi:parallel beta-helix repeat protein
LLVGAVFPVNAMFVFSHKQISFNNGNILYVGGGGHDNYTKIQDAIDNSSEGDTIFVYDDSSPYYENLRIEITIDLIGENKDTTTVDGNCLGNVINIYADSVNVSGFTIQNSGYEYGIEVNGFEIYSQDNVIENNRILSNNIGIFAESINNNFRENFLTNNHIGFGIINSIGFSIIKNLFSENNFGICIFNSNENTIKENIFSKTLDQGMFLNNADLNIISNNEFLVNNCGISLSNCEDNSIICNTISNNYYGLTLIDESKDNIIYHNNFIENQDIQAVDPFYNTWDDGNYGNYWSDYKDKYPDAKKVLFKGIWDTPYEIPGWANNDMYPLVDEWPSPRSKNLMIFAQVYKYPMWNFFKTLSFLKEVF